MSNQFKQTDLMKKVLFFVAGLMIAAGAYAGNGFQQNDKKDTKKEVKKETKKEEKKEEKKPK